MNVSETVAIKQPLMSKSADSALPESESVLNALHKHQKLVGLVLILFMLVMAIASLGIGRYALSPQEVLAVLANGVMDAFPGMFAGDSLAVDSTAQTVVLSVRLPRIIVALLVGGGLAVAGATLQALFQNPLVSPDVIGVSSGASFGGVLAIAIGAGSFGLLFGAMAGGILAVIIVLGFAALRSGSPILTVVLGGIVASSFFSALVSLVTYLADPYTTLPAITFWLMGSLASVTYSNIPVVVLPVVIGFVVSYTLRWRINILALGDEDAQSLGVNPQVLRIILIATVAFMVASTVAVAGVIGWIGLVIPHLVRLLAGTDYRQVIPYSFFAGASFLLVVDTIARSASAGEIPIGVITALIGAPFFAYLLIKNRNEELGHA